MREIKFKIYAQHDETGQIVSEDFDYISIFNGGAHKYIEANWTLNRYAVISKGQFTGLLDKNGKEVYEGDFLGWPTRTFPEDRVTSYSVGFNGYMWDLFNISEGKWEADGKYFFTQVDNMEVIGNVFENPELLTPNPTK